MKFVISFVIASLILANSMLAQVTGLAGWNIFLDPGHSQRENMGIYNYSEAEKNLRVGLALREMLLNKTDIDTVYMSRTNDQQVVSLSQRTDYANSLGAAWFHSIHSDAGSSENNSTLLLWGQYYNKQEKVPNGGKEMSDYMVDVLTAGMRTNTRGSIGDCTFYSYTGACSPSWPGPYLHVNRESTMPSELSEAGFHTNPRQNQLNMNAQWKRLEAKTFYWSILDFFTIQRPAEGICTGIITDKDDGTPVNGAKVTINGQTYVTDTYESLFHKYSNDPNLLHNGFYYFEHLPVDTTLEMIVERDKFYSDTSRVVIGKTFFSFKDPKVISKIPPTVISTTPADGDTNFPAWEPIIFNFSRQMNRPSVEANLVIAPQAKVLINWGSNGRKLIIKGDSLAFYTNYAITISGKATDIYGHPFDGNADESGGDDFTLHFKTGPPDMTAPRLLSTYPPRNSSSIELRPIINATFDEAIDTLSITADKFKLERSIDQSAAPGILKHYLVNNQSVFCFFPTAKLFSNESYIIRIYPGLYDLFGNKITTIKTSNFRTSTEDDQITKIDDFETNLIGNWWVPQSSGSTTGIITEKTSRSENKEILNLLTNSTRSLQVNYGWDLGASSWLIRLYIADSAPAKTVLFNKDFILQAYVFGDGSGNQFRFCVDDNYPNLAAANHEVSPWFTINWLGWKLISWNMSKDGTGTWIGDGNLDGTLRLESLQFTYNPGSPVTGTLYFDDLRIVKKVPVSVSVTEPAMPRQSVLHQNYPNPFNAETSIKYEISGGRQYVRLEIFDILGKKVRTLVNEHQIGGFYQINWDGKDDHGKQVASGIFIYKIDTGSFAASKRMILLR